MKMIVTDDPMPGVAPVGSHALWVIGVKDGDAKVVIGFAEDQTARAKECMKSLIYDYTELLLVEGVSKYRIWTKDA